MAYDRMDWHYGADGFPQNLDYSQGGVHIGMFIAWAIINNLSGAFHDEESRESLEAVRVRSMTGLEFLQVECDEKFWEEDLSEIGNRFAKAYYSTNQYLDDYVEIFDEQYQDVYAVENNWENYDKIAQRISTKFNLWKIRNA